MNNLLKKIVILSLIFVVSLVLFLPQIGIFAAAGGGYCFIEPCSDGVHYFFACPSDICGNEPALAVCLICVTVE